MTKPISSKSEKRTLAAAELHGVSGGSLYSDLAAVVGENGVSVVGENGVSVVGENGVSVVGENGVSFR